MTEHISLRALWLTALTQINLVVGFITLRPHDQPYLNPTMRSI
jgi:hypothetical protein